MSTLRANTLSDASGSNSVPMATVANGSAKAWVNFNGTGTVSIRAAFNVSSITDNGTGDYTANFTTAMPDGNYAAVGMIWRDRGSEYYDFGIHGKGNTSPTASGFNVVTGYSVPNNFDPGFVCLSVFR